MKEIKIQIPEEVVNGIQLKDFEAVSMQAVITNMLESHSLDADTRIIESPVFLGYQAKLVNVKKEFEQAKDKMILTYVEESLRKQVTNWNLDYSSCTLYLQLAE